MPTESQSKKSKKPILKEKKTSTSREYDIPILHPAYAKAMMMFGGAMSGNGGEENDEE
jgi:hypothetical protein